MVSLAPTALDQYALELSLLEDLHDLLLEPLDAKTTRWILAVLDVLLETLPSEIEFKEHDGYLSEVTDVQPSWCGAVDKLHEEHAALFDELHDLRRALLRQSGTPAMANRVLTNLQHWMHGLEAHHHHENRLLQTAMNLDIGGGD